MNVIPVIVVIIVIIITIVSMLIAILTSSQTKFLPVNTTQREISQPTDQNLYTIYFALKDLDIEKLENNVMESNIPLTPENISDLVDKDLKAKAIEWLGNNGVYYNWAGTGTMGLWQPSVDFLKSIGKNLYSSPGIYQYTLNDYYQFPYGITVYLFNQVADPKVNLKSLQGWVNEKNLFDYNSNPVGGNTVNTSTMGGLGDIQSIFLYEITSISNQSIEVFTEYYNNKYLTSYDPIWFKNRINGFILDRELNIIPTPLTDNTYIYDLENNTEALIDIFIALEAEISSKIYVSCGILDGGTVFPDANPIVQAFIKNNIKCQVFSSSFGRNIKPNKKDYNRVGIESRLYSLYDITQFNASGDQGSWYYGNIDINRPDHQLGAFCGDAIISVGGYSNILNSKISMNGYNIDNYNVFSFPFASGGGMSRYYPNPNFKQKSSKSYQYKHSIREIEGRDGNTIINKECQVESGGYIYPDIVGKSAVIYPEMVTPSFGTSIAAPTVACKFLNMKNNLHFHFSGKPILCFHRVIYSDNTNFLNKVVQGRNTYGPLLGYTGDNESLWDPINGRGEIDFEKAYNYFSSRK